MSSFDEMWKNAILNMKEAIKSNNNIYDYLMNFEPDENTGYSFTNDPIYKKYSNYLDSKTGGIHSGASFACCVRQSVQELKNKNNHHIIIHAQEVNNHDDNIPILKNI